MGRRKLAEDEKKRKKTNRPAPRGPVGDRVDEAQTDEGPEAEHLGIPANAGAYPLDGEGALVMADIDGGRLGVLAVGDCVPNPWNPQTMDAVTFARLKEEIADKGCISAITVVDLEDGTYRIIGGEHRWRASQELGKQYIPATILNLDDWDEDRQKFEVVKLNVLHGDLDPRKFLPLYQEVASKYGAEAVKNLFAFTDEKKWRELVSRLSEGVKKTLSGKAAKEFDEKAQKAQTIEDLTSIIQEMFSTYGSTLKQGYMVLSYGGEKHVYVQMDTAMRRALDRVMDWLGFTKGNINEFMAGVLDDCLAKAEAEFEAREQIGDGDDVQTGADLGF